LKELLGTRWEPVDPVVSLIFPARFLIPLFLICGRYVLAFNGSGR
jgi:hypothetical protein